MTFMTCEIKQREKSCDIIYKKILKESAGGNQRGDQRGNYGRKNWTLREKYARKIYRGKLPA